MKSMHSLSVESAVNRDPEAALRARMEDEGEMVEGRLVEIQSMLEEELRSVKLHSISVSQWFPFDARQALDELFMSHTSSLGSGTLTLRFLKGLFHVLDRDGNGILDRDELKAGMATSSFDVSNEQGFDILFNMIDADGNGEISESEWEAALRGYLDDRERRLKQEDRVRRRSSSVSLPHPRRATDDKGSTRNMRRSGISLRGFSTRSLSFAD